jgi:predicted lipoprotein with Yx(FWY)xxD motif
MSGFAGLALLAGCGGGSKATGTYTTSAAAVSTTQPAVTSGAPSAAGVSVRNVEVPGLGQVVANAEGHTLYTFVPDHRAKVTCVSSCAIVWPPLKLPSGATAVVAGKTQTALLGSDPDPEGGRVVTYSGWPLYLYAGDTGPGTAKGQALNLNGGVWYVISPTGTVITKAP